MKGLRRSLGLLLVPLLIALLAVPAGAAPQKDKTNEDHAAWFELDPVAPTTNAAEVTMTGKVAGNFDMMVVNGAWSEAFVAKGQFAVTVPLAPGANSIQFSGANGHGRFINHSVTVTRKVPAPSSLAGTVSGQLVADGQSTATLTVAAYDASGAVMTSFAGPISVLATGNSLTVDTPTVNAVGGVATFVLRATTTPGVVQLTLTSPQVPSSSVQVIVQSPPPVLSSLTTSLSGTLVADGKSTATLTVTALDQYGATLTSYNGPVIVLPLPGISVDTVSVNAESGAATFVLQAGTVVGMIPVTVVIPGIPPVTVQVNVAQAPPVEPEGPFLSGMTTALTGSLVADGQSTATLTVTALDENGAVMTSYNGSVYLDGYGSMLTVEPWVAMAQGGVATFTLRAGMTPGQVQVRVTIPTLDPVIVPVDIAPLPHLEAVLDGSLIADGQSQAILRVTVVDRNGNTMPNYSEPITVSTSNPPVLTAASSVVPVNGVAEILLTAGTEPGTAYLILTAPGVTSAGIEVTVAEVPATSLGLRYSLSNSLQAYSDTEATLTIEVVNTATGRVVRTYTDSLTLTSSNADSASVLTPTVVPVNGVAVATLKSGLSYEPAFVEVAGPGLAAVTVPITPLPPAPRNLSTILGGTLKVGNPTTATLTVWVYNMAGELATYYAEPITVTSSDPSVAVVKEPSMATPVDGVATFEISAGSRHGSATLILNAPGLAETYLPVRVGQPDPARMQLTVGGVLVAGSSLSTTNLTVTVYDTTGQVATGYSGPVTITSSNPEAVKVLGASAQVVNGVAQTTLGAGSMAVPATITATAPGLAAANLTVVPVPQIPTRLTLRGEPTRLPIGENAQGTIYLQLKDQLGADVVSLSGPVNVRLTTNIPSAIHFASGETADFSMLTPSMTVPVTAGMSTGLATITGTATRADGGTLQVDSIQFEALMPGVPAKLGIDPVPAVTTGSTFQVTVRVLDNYGNPLTYLTDTVTVSVTLQAADGTLTSLGSTSLVNGVGTLNGVAPAPGTYTVRASGSWWGDPLVPGQTTLYVLP